MKRLRQKKQHKEKKSSSDDDESDWVQVAIAAAGLGLSMYDKYKQGKIDDKMADQLEGQNVQNFVGLDASAQTYEAEREFSNKRYGEDVSDMGASGAMALGANMSQIRDSKASFAGNYQTGQMKQNVMLSAWDVYNDKFKALDRQKEEALLTSLTSAGGASAEYMQNIEETESQIRGLRA